MIAYSWTKINVRRRLNKAFDDFLQDFPVGVTTSFCSSFNVVSRSEIFFAVVGRESVMVFVILTVSVCLGL